LRVLLMHVGKGTRCVRLRCARGGQGWPKSRMWRCCCGCARRSAGAAVVLGLLQESGWSVGADPRHWNLRAVDGTLVQESGRTGAQWRIHYSLQLPSLECDAFEMTAARGPGTGEKLERLAVAPGDLILADRGFCRPAGVAAVARQGAALILRLHSCSLPLYHAGRRRFVLVEELRKLTQPGQVGEWNVQVRSAEGAISGRLCALRKSQQATAQASAGCCAKRRGTARPPALRPWNSPATCWCSLPFRQATSAPLKYWSCIAADGKSNSTSSASNLWRNSDTYQARRGCRARLALR